MSPRTLRSSFVAALVALGLAPEVSAQQRVYLGNDDHTDYFWTATDVGYRTAFLAMLDYYMTQAEATAGNPSDFRGRFTCDNALWVWEYEHNRTPAQFNRLVGHLRSGAITMSMQSLVPLYGAMPTEAVLRDLYYAGRLERRYGLDFNIVQSMENATLPAGVASLWAGAGARYSWRGVCGCASQVNLGPRPREIYNAVGPDGRGVVMKWNTSNGNESLGGYAEARFPDGAVRYMTGDAGFRSRWPYDVMAAFGYGHDDFQTTTDIMIRTAMSMSTPTRRVIVSNETDFFVDFMATYGTRIPTYTGSFGNEWDLLTASLADATARMRRAVEKLRTAEAIAAVVALRDPTILAGREVARDEAFLRMGMYYDHDWTADTPMGRTPRLNFQRDSVARVEGYVNALHDESLARLATLIAAPASTGQRFVVFNSLGWARTDVVDLPATVAAPLRVVDMTTGAEVPSQVVTVGGATRVRALARDLPAVGYKVFEVRSGAGAAFPPAATVAGGVVDNGRYRVTVAADGSITALLDHRAADRDLVRAGLALNRRTGATAGTIVTESVGPVSATLRVTAGGAPAHTTRVTVYAGLDRVDLENRITQNFGGTVGYQFDFRASGYTIRHEEVGMIARVARNAAGGDYADALTRTDYLSFNHFVDLSESGFGVTLSNADSSFMRVANSRPSTLDTSLPSVFAVAGMQVDGRDLGFANQGGDTSFLNRYALVAHGAYDQPAAMRMALEHQNPLVAQALAPAATAALPTRLGLVAVSSPDVLVWAVKPAEEGIARGVVVRAWNLAETPRTFDLTAPGSTLRSAVTATHIETDTGAATVTAGRVAGSLARQQMQTWRLTLDGLVTTPVDAGMPMDAAVDAPVDVPADLPVIDAREAGIDAGSDVRDVPGAPDADATTPDAPRPDVAPPPDVVRVDVTAGEPDAAMPPPDAAMPPPDADPLPDAAADAPRLDAPDATPDVAGLDGATNDLPSGVVVDAAPDLPMGVVFTDAAPPTGEAPGGCGCRAPGAPTSPTSSTLALASAFALAASRRRRRLPRDAA